MRNFYKLSCKGINLKALVTMVIVILCVSTNSILAQCTNGTLYPTAFNAPGPGVNYTISTLQYRGGEHNRMNGVAAGNTFQSTATTATTYITVRAGTFNGTVVAAGVQPLNWTAVAGGTYFIHYNTNSGCGTSTNTMTTRVQNTSPAYNPCTTIPTIASCGSNSTASFSAGNSAWNITACGYNTPGQERIYSFTPSTTASYSIQQSSSSFYVDYFYKAASGGCNNSGWTCIDDLSGAVTSPTFTLTAGVQYYFLLDPETNGAGTATFNIACPPSPPANDAPCNATALTSNTSCSWSSTQLSTNGSLSFAANGACGGNPNDDVWYSFVAQQPTHTINIDGLGGFDFCFGGGGYDPILELYSGTCGSLTTMGCVDGTCGGETESGIATGLVVGQTYYFRVYDFFGGYNGNGFQVCITHAVPVVGDDICAATVLTASGTTACTGSVTGDLNGATASPVAICAGSAPVNDIWFRFTAVNANQTIRVDASVVLDAVVQVFSSSNNTCSGTLTQLACMDNFGDDGIETVGLTGLTVGNTYFVRVHDWYSGVPPSTTFTICVTTPPANDQCANATPLTVGGAAISGTVTSASQTNGSNRNDVWYSFTPCATASHTITINNFNPAGNKDIYIYNASCPVLYNATAPFMGQSVSTTTEVVTGTFTAGQVYYIMVQDFDMVQGTFDISVTGPTANIALSNAGTPPAGFVNAGTTNVTLYGFTLTPQCGANYNFTGVTVSNTGTATATDLTNLRVFYDANNNGAWDGGDVLCGAAVPVSSSMAYTITGQTGITGTRQYIVVGNVAIGAFGGNTFNGTNAAATVSVPISGAAVGNTITIRPYNNDCAGAFAFPTLVAGCNTMPVNTGGANQTIPANCGGNADDDVWYSFTMPVGYSAIAFSNTDIWGNNDRRLEFFSGTCGSLTPVPSGCFDPETGNLAGLTPGATYYVRAYTTGAGVSTYFDLCIALTPANNDCAGAIVFPTLAPGCTNIDVNTLGATQSMPGCLGTADDDVWYQFTLPIGYTAVSYSMTDISGNNDRIIEFFSTSCGVGTFGCTTNEAGTLTTLTPGATYWLRVYTAGSGVSSNFTLCLALPPVNDDCANAIAFPTLQPGCTSVDVSTGAATGSGQPTCGGASADDDVWYTFVVPVGGSTVGYSMTNISGNTDRVMQLYSDCGVTQVYCNTAESGTFPGILAAGTYWARVYTFAANVNSNFELCIALPPANDNVCNATLLSTPEICSSTQGTVQMATPSAPANGISAGCSGNADDDVWYKFVAGSTTHTVTVNGSAGFDAVIQAYTGACPTLAAMIPITCGDATGVGATEVLILRNLTVGTTYHVRVYDKATGVSTSPTFDICITENPLGIPIAYYDFEDNANRNTIANFQSVVEVSTNTQSSFSRSGGTFSGMAGAGLLHVGAGAGTAIVGTPADDPTSTISPVSYIEVPINASGFQTMAISFDLYCEQISGTHPYVGVNLSINGGATWSSLTLLNTTLPNVWQLSDPVTLPVSCNNNPNVRIRLYGYNAASYNPTFAIDNFTLFAASTAVGAGTKTLVSFPVVYTGVKSGSTGSQFPYDKFTANGTGSTVNLISSDIVLDNTLVVTNSGTFNFGTGITPTYLSNLGTASFTLDPTSTIGITDAAGITTSGSTGNVRGTGARAYSTLGNYTYIDNAAQVTGNGLPVTVNNLTINNAAGVTLSGNVVTVNGVLGLTSGILRTATFATDNVIIGAAGSVSQTGGWVYGNLRKPVTTGNPVRAFEIGNLTNYTPVVLTFASVATPGNYTARAITPSHPNIGSSCLSNTQKVNAYYKLVNGGVAPANYTASFNYTAGEVVGSPTLANLVVGKYNGGWVYPTVSGMPTGTNTTISNGSGDGEYQIAQGVVPSVTLAASPSGSTCPGTSILFTATQTNGGTPNYEFFENGVSVQNGPSNTYSSTTVANGQQVTVTMTSTAGCITTTTANATPVTVSRYVSPSLSATDPTPVCMPSTISLVGVATDVNGTTGNFTYYATLANAQAGTSPISSTISTSGTYYIRKTVTSGGGCYDIIPVTVTINPTPSLTITNPPVVCSGNTADITAVGVAVDANSVPGSFSYFPTLADANANTNPLANPAAIAVAGTYYIKKTSGAGCFDIEPVTVTIQTCGVVTWEGDINTDWHTGGNWNLGYVPTTTDNIIIPNVANDPLISTGPGVARDVQINAGAIITINSGLVLTTNGNWTGTPTTTVTGAGKIIFASNLPQTITGGGAFSTLQVNNTNGVTVAAGANIVNVTTALELRAGQLTTNANVKTISNVSSTGIIDDFSAGFTGTMSGTVSVERFITIGPNGFRYIGIPVTSTNGGTSLPMSGMTGFTASGTPGQIIPLANCNPNNVSGLSPYGNFMRWEEAGPFPVAGCRQSGWRFQTTPPMTVGRGYGAKLSGGNKLTYTGFANTGSKTYGPLSWTNSTGDGWQLVSNPFPSNIGISSVSGDGNPSNDMPAGFDGQIQLYMTSGPYTGSYLAYNAGLAAAPIALGQGFWVRTAGTANFTLTNSHRVTNNVSYYSTDIQQHLKVNVAGNSFMDMTDIYFLPQAQGGFDFYDAEKWDSRSEQPTLYTKVGSTQTAINSLHSLEETVVVPMGMKAGTNGSFTFTFDDIATFPQTSMIYLEDLQLGTMNNLRANNTYAFTMNATDNPDRFMLHFQPGLQADVADQNCDNTGSIELTQPAPTTWATYEVKGTDNNVYAQGTNLTGTITINNLPAQEYVVTVTHTSGYTAQEFITVNGSNPVNATINASATTIQVDELVSLNATANNATNYSWNFGDGITQTGTTATVHAYDAEGTYTVSMTASNNDCNSTVTKVINVVKTTTGINGTEANNINIYGQGEHVVIEFNSWGGSKADVFMYNALGQRVESLTGVSTIKGRQELHIANIIPGTYFIQVVSDGKLEGKKLFLGKN